MLVAHHKLCLQALVWGLRYLVGVFWCDDDSLSRVRPFISEELKHAWIQYLSFLLIALFLVDWLKWFVFSRGLVASFVSLDTSGPRKLHAS